MTRRTMYLLGASLGGSANGALIGYLSGVSWEQGLSLGLLLGLLIGHLHTCCAAPAQPMQVQPVPARSAQSGH